MKRLVVLVLSVAACAGRPPAPHAPVARPVVAPAVCEMDKTRARPSSSGDETVKSGGETHALHWVKLDAPKKPARGTVFYLAGGPMSHMLYTDLAAKLQAAAYPDRDVVLYDYFGFNCSTPIQDRASLAAHESSLTMPAMASDFIQLKRGLVGKDAKVIVMGGSHGAMLGAAIVGAYPNEIERAILFSGDTQSGWLDDGWYRFDRLMTKLDAAHPGFAASLQKMLASASDRPMLEVGLWMVFSLDSAAQAALPVLVSTAESGDRKWIDNVATVAKALLEAPKVAPPPTESSRVTTFHRCNVWWPKSRRAAPARETRFFHHESFVSYWNTLCAEDDALGEHPFVAPASRTHVPILTWVGDQDTFDPAQNRAHWEALSDDVTFHVMEGWSHDFGPNAGAGFVRVLELVKAFVDRR